MKKKLYEESWFIFAMLILFTPLGIILLFITNDTMTKKTKVILSLIFGLIFISFFGMILYKTRSLDDENNQYKINEDISVIVADFSTMTSGDTNNWCKDNKINCTISSIYSQDIIMGKFVSQSVEKETSIFEGETIEISYSLGRESIIYYNGVLKVEEDIEEGKYIIEGTGNVEICLSENCNGDNQEIIFNADFDNRIILALKNNQYLKFNISGIIYNSNDYNY